MDPNETWKAYLKALEDIDELHKRGEELFDARERAIEYGRALREWLGMGGFEPDWTAAERVLFLHRW